MLHRKVPSNPGDRTWKCRTKPKQAPSDSDGPIFLRERKILITGIRLMPGRDGLLSRAQHERKTFSNKQTTLMSIKGMH